MRRAALVLLLVRVFLQVLFGLMPAGKVHTRAYQAPRSPAPWGFEARKVGKIGRRAYALRVQVLTVAV
jgi:hypothetical protein